MGTARRTFATAAVALLVGVLVGVLGATPTAAATTIAPRGDDPDLAPRDEDYDDDLAVLREAALAAQEAGEAELELLETRSGEALGTLAEAQQRLERAEQRSDAELVSLGERTADREAAESAATAAATAAAAAGEAERAAARTLARVEGELATVSEVLRERVVVLHKRGPGASDVRLNLLEAALGADTIAEIAWAERALQGQTVDVAALVASLTDLRDDHAGRHAEASEVARAARGDATRTRASLRRTERAEIEQRERTSAARRERDRRAATVADLAADVAALEDELETVREVLAAFAEELDELAREQAGRPVWPVEGRRASGLGFRPDPFTGERSFHSGLDLAAPPGTPVVAMWAGRVVHAGPRGGYGLLVELDHGDGITTRYAHLSRVDVTVGAVVRRGEPIGAVGSTGRSTGPHLHLEVRERGVVHDPEPLLP
jgi:murein DD-endopeptidase MepM/ murein hydrolase activator NlpD